MSDEPIDWVLRHMPDECAVALDEFTQANTGLAGAHWDDCLDMLMSTDAHIDLAGVILDRLDDSYNEGLVYAVALTLYYASMGFRHLGDDQRTVMVKATIDNNEHRRYHKMDAIEKWLVEQADLFDSSNSGIAAKSGVLATATAWHRLSPQERSALIDEYALPHQPAAFVPDTEAGLLERVAAYEAALSMLSAHVENLIQRVASLEEDAHAHGEGE